jgi:hypothetical protein
LICRGVKQVEGARAQLEDNLYEMSKPLTRTVVLYYTVATMLVDLQGCETGGRCEGPAGG